MKTGSNRRKIVSSGDDAVVNIWDVNMGLLIRSLKGHSLVVWSAKFSPDGTKIASCSFDKTFKLRDALDGQLLRNNADHGATVVAVAFSQDGKIMATTGDDKTIRIWNAATGGHIRTMKVAEHVQAVAFSADDKLLMTGGRDKPMIGEFLQNIFGDSKFNKGVSARIFDVQTGQLLQTFTEHANDVNDVD